MKKIIFVCAVALVFLGGNALAATICVDPGGGGTYTSLQDALDAGETNNEADTIKVVQGTYNGNFTYDSDQGHMVILEGGYVPGTSCSERVLDPANTVLDAGESGRVLFLNNSEGGHIWVAGFTIQNGNAFSDGGGVYAESSSGETAGNVVLGTNIIKDNYAGQYGGGVYAKSSSFSSAASDVFFTNNIVTTNASGSSGGGISARSSTSFGIAGDVIITGNTISGNGAESNYGGGVYASCSAVYGTSGKLTLTSNTIIGNNAQGRGGGVYANLQAVNGTEGVVFTNNVIAENDVIGEGAGSYIKGDSSPGGDIIITNNTVVKNNSLQTNGGICFIFGANIIKCYNNIIRGNTAGNVDGKDIYLSGTGLVYGYNNNYSSLYGAWTLSGFNIDKKPLLTGNYHLKFQSPCIDAGNNSPPDGLPTTDFEGDDRKIDGDRNGVAAVDMGADEYMPQAMIAPLFILLSN